MKKVIIIICIILSIIVFDTIQSLVFNTSPALSFRTEDDYGYVYDDGLLSYSQISCDGTKKTYRFFRGPAIHSHDCHYYVIDLMTVSDSKEK